MPAGGGGAQFIEVGDELLKSDKFHPFTRGSPGDQPGLPYVTGKQLRWLQSISEVAAGVLVIRVVIVALVATRCFA